MFCYSNNGESMRAVARDYLAQAGEVLFITYATDEQLEAVFPGYITAKANRDAETQAKIIQEPIISQIDKYQNKIIYQMGKSLVYLLGKLPGDATAVALRTELLDLWNAVDVLRQQLIDAGGEL